MPQTVIFLIFQFNVSTNFEYTHLNVKTVQFLTIQFSISTQFKKSKRFYFKRFSLAV